MKWKIFLFLLMVVMTGCSAKQGTNPGVSDFIALPGTEDLSKPEVAALNSSGQIDKNMPAAEMEDVKKHYKYFLNKGRSSVCAVNEKSSHYLAYARQTFKKRGMPEELANLAIVESGYRPTAVSHSGAAGTWQFMPATGERYGLIQDYWQDERMDPYKATEAAAEYLQYLHNYFGDWPTAIAAYNAGEGKLSRAKEGTGAKDFYEVKARNEMLDEKTKLKDETKNYVPKFMAVTKIMRNLENLGFDSPQEENALKIHRLSAAPGTDLLALSRACALPWKDFNVYNPHHKRTITCTDRKTFVYIPEQSQKLAEEYLNSHQQGEFAGWKLIKVKKAPETLAKLGKRYNIPLASLEKANPGIGKIKSGQLVLLPEKLSLAASSAVNGASEKQSAGSKVEHKIAANETLYAIARKYNVEPKLLQSYNSIANPSCLKPGQLLKIPLKKTETKNVSRKNYVVQPKDSLWSISRKLNISVADLKKWNNITEKQLKAGAVLTVSN